MMSELSQTREYEKWRHNIHRDPVMEVERADAMHDELLPYVDRAEQAEAALERATKTLRYGEEKDLPMLYAESQAALAERERWINDLQSGMYINCVYCGHRYGPDDDVGGQTMRTVLEAHIATCPKHPLSIAKAALAERDAWISDIEHAWDTTDAGAIETTLAAWTARAEEGGEE